MNIYAIVFFDPHSLKGFNSKVYDSNLGWFEKRHVKEFINFGSKELLNHLELDYSDPKDCNFIIRLQNSFYVYFHISVGSHPSTSPLSSGDCGCALLFSSKNDNIQVPNSCKLSMQFVIANYMTNGIIPDLENLESCFKIHIVKSELNETHKELHRTISKVLKRGENIEQLVDRTELLSESSKIFFKNSSNLNSCCWGLARKW